MKKLKNLLKTLKVILFVLAGLIVTALVVSLIPTPNAYLISNPNPAQDYSSAVSQFEVLKAAEESISNSDSGSLLFDHGYKTENVYVLIHGTTNSPRQFEELGKILFSNGHNVLILRMPFHGLSSHSVSELKALTADDLRSYADQTIDIGSALGDQLTVIGISGGGVVASWIAQNRSEVDRAMLVVPFFGVSHLPRFLDEMVINLFGRIPNFNFINKLEPARSWVYRGESTRGVASFLLISKQVYQQAKNISPMAGELFIITTSSDTNVNNQLTDEMINLRQANGKEIQRFDFDASLKIPHNSIDPAADVEKRNMVYTQILEMLGE